jgi:hypothetical protein
MWQWSGVPIPSESAACLRCHYLLVGATGALWEAEEAFVVVGGFEEVRGRSLGYGEIFFRRMLPR